MKKMMENNDIKSGKRQFLWYFAALLLALLAIFLIFLSTISYKPAEYEPIISDGKGQISPILTNKILPQIYNNSQLEEPFEIALSEQQINEVIGDMPFKLDKAAFKNPCVKLENDVFKFMVSSNLAGIAGVVTADFRADGNKLALEKIKIGRLNCTKLLKNKISRAIEGGKLVKDEKTARFFKEMLSSSAEIPPIKVDKNWLKVEDVKVSDGNIKIVFKPLGRKKPQK